jgi:hypothetical protein
LASAQGGAVREFQAIFGGGRKLFCKLRLVDMTGGLGKQELGAGFHRSSGLEEKPSGVRRLMHHGESKDKVDRPIETVEAHRIGWNRMRVDALEQTRSGGATLQPFNGSSRWPIDAERSLP